MIFDTDVLIWFLRGNEQAVSTVVESVPFSISIVTYMELLQGMRNKQEMYKMKKAFANMGVEIIPISEAISKRAAELVETYTLSHSMEMADALIAASCLEMRQTLYTANDKHYKMIDGLMIDVFRP
ncbi:type II toxin-antitoxin system VapC family toxin [Butyrivibrio sp. AE2032]|uniref:type II toxin-antitoxin system VapC family toxin n=1 Tax=Butyrivibrio sp. AE2032 TaxID=1458463 RepID=UPI00055328AC|nr:type II toxin-antitoxin system VapC family toxin [Butyrivibrio sp. AE2032]